MERETIVQVIPKFDQEIKPAPKQAFLASSVPTDTSQRTRLPYEKYHRFSKAFVVASVAPDVSFETFVKDKHAGAVSWVVISDGVPAAEVYTCNPLRMYSVSVGISCTILQRERIDECISNFVVQEFASMR